MGSALSVRILTVLPTPTPTPTPPIEVRAESIESWAKLVEAIGSVLWPVLAFVAVLIAAPTILSLLRVLQRRFEEDEKVRIKIGVIEAELRKSVIRATERLQTGELGDQAVKPLAPEKAEVVRQLSADSTSSIRPLYELVLAEIAQRAEAAGIPIFGPEPSVQEIATALTYSGNLPSALLGDIVAYQSFADSALSLPDSRVDASTVVTFRNFTEALLSSLEGAG